MSDDVISLSSEASEASEASEQSEQSEKGKDEISSPSWNAQKKRLHSFSVDNNEKKDLKKQKCNSPQSDRSNGKSNNNNKIVRPKLVPITKKTNSDDAFQMFVKTCSEKRSDDTAKNIIQKLKKLYKKLSLLDQNNEEFRLYVIKCHDKITKNICKDIYTPILELRNEMKKRIRSQSADQESDDNGTNEYEMKIPEDIKKKIKLLEDCIKKCHQKIKELEDEEVDFDKDEDSAYVKVDKYKKKLIQLCNCLSKLNGDTEMRKQILKKKIKRKDISDIMTDIPSIDEAIINFINSDIGKINQMKYLVMQRCADLLQMPEYLDILKCVEKCNENSNLDLSDEKMVKLAKRAFLAIGNYLKKKRMDETKLYIHSLVLNPTDDPALKDPELLDKLQRSKAEGDKNLKEIFKTYIDKQDGLDHENVEHQNECDSDSNNESASVDAETEDEFQSVHSEKNLTNVENEADKSPMKENKTLDKQIVLDTVLECSDTDTITNENQTNSVKTTPAINDNVDDVIVLETDDSEDCLEVKDSIKIDKADEDSKSVLTAEMPTEINSVPMN